MQIINLEQKLQTELNYFKDETYKIPVIVDKR